MVIFLKNFEDFKAIVNKVNLVVFYETEKFDITGIPNEETQTKEYVTLYVVDNNTSYGFKNREAMDEGALKNYLMQFDEAIEIDSIN